MRKIFGVLLAVSMVLINVYLPDSRIPQPESVLAKPVRQCVSTVRIAVWEADTIAWDNFLASRG